MVGMIAGSGTELQIVGHGLTVDQEVELADGVWISPETPDAFETSFPSSASKLQAHAAMLAMERLATFSLKIHHASGGAQLAAKGWNSLWTFGLLSLACRSPIVSLYSVAKSLSEPMLANRNLVILPAEQLVQFDEARLEWARANYARFNAMVADERFSAAQRYYGNAHYLPDLDARIMLLWAGIEGLLSVDGELRRRIALHAAILHDGTKEEKLALFEQVKRAYDIRSKIVHGSRAEAAKLEGAAQFASDLLVGLLRKAVELGRVPAPAELDEAAASVMFA